MTVEQFKKELKKEIDTIKKSLGVQTETIEMVMFWETLKDFDNLKVSSEYFTLYLEVFGTTEAEFELSREVVDYLVENKLLVYSDVSWLDSNSVEYSLEMNLDNL